MNPHDLRTYQTCYVVALGRPYDTGMISQISEVFAWLMVLSPGSNLCIPLDNWLLDLAFMAEMGIATVIYRLGNCGCSNGFVTRSIMRRLTNGYS
jgi:hypothetical protein